MDKALYDDVVLFLRDASFNPIHARDRFRDRNARKYSLYGRRLRLGSRVVLHEEEAFDALRSLNLQKRHLRGPEVLRAVQNAYVVPLVKSYVSK